MTGFLVTGTDTGVGKTLVACAVVRALIRRGYRVAVHKPVETGCRRQGGHLHPADAHRLNIAAGRRQPLRSVCPHAFAAPLAPALAAAQSGRRLSPRLLRRAAARAGAGADILVVEGVGGLLVPLATRYLVADLACDLGLPLVVVVGSRLGAINHTLLTLTAARARNLAVAGYVLNHPTAERSAAVRTNAAVLRALSGVPCLGIIPHLRGPARLARAAARLDVEALIGCLHRSRRRGAQPRRPA